MEATPVHTITVEATAGGSSEVAVDQPQSTSTYSANKLFEYIKSAISSIPVNEALFEKSVAAIEKTTEFINKNTSLVVVFDLDKLQEILTSIDEAITKNLIKLDDGCDHLRTRLGSSLEDLSGAVEEHKKWVHSLVSSRATETRADEAVEPTETPFSTAKIFSLLKSTLARIPVNRTFFDQSINAIDEATLFINRNTRLNLVFDVDKLSELISTTDGMISENLTKFDDGFDNLRLRLNDSLRELKSAAESHKEWATTTMQTTEQRVSAQMKARYEVSRDTLALAVSLARDNYNAAHSAVMNKDKTLQEKVVDSAKYLLDTAQPYVQDAIKRGQPLVDKALETAQPYYEKAQPYVDPVVNKAVGLNKQLQEHEVVGPFVSKAVDTANTVFEATKDYCGTGTDSTAMEAVEALAPEAIQEE